ncbi:substrate-binding protein%2C ABC-type transporter [Mycobacterium tuberculosis]|nr:substrate-binding protein%2C ABC-type transporter [Mycobacterium tuberculosis]
MGKVTGRRALTRAGAVLAAASLVLGATACGSGDGGSGGEGELTKVRITATLIDTLPFMSALKIAADRGDFKNEGLDVEFASAAGGGNTLRALSTGDADIAIGSPAASVLAAQSDPRVKIASLWAPRNGFYWIGPKEVSDLNGTKIGGSVPGATVNLLLAGVEKKENIKFAEIVPAGGMGENWAASKSGQVVGGWAMEPFITEKVQNDGAKVVVDAPKSLPWFPADMVVVNKEWADKNQEAMTSFFAAMSTVFGDISSDPAKMAPELSKIMNIDAAIIEKSIADAEIPAEELYSYKTVPEALETVSELMNLSGQVSEPIDWKSIFDQKYLPEDARADF